MIQNSPVSAAPAGAAPGDPTAPRNLPATRSGKVRPMILLWALGVPIPLILLLLLLRSCM